MKSKSLLIAVAAFAVTATGVQAHVGIGQLSRAGFTTNQIEAFSEARELRAKGEVEKARDVLLDAGVDEKKLNTLRKISHRTHYKSHHWLELTDEQRDALRVARQSNDHETVQAILEEVGMVK